MTDQMHKSKLLEATLELGRNWAVAVAIAGFAAASYHSESILGVWRHRVPILYGTLFVSLIWMGLAVRRFLDVVSFPTASKLQSAKAVGVLTALVGCGLSLVYAAASFGDNANAVRVCSAFADRPNSAIHKAGACQLLYKRREELERRYSGE